jgi:Domain of unknown function (DUF1874)
MSNHQLALLNTSILTAYGNFTYAPMVLTDAQIFVQTAYHGLGCLSAIGHESTAAILTELLEIPVAVNRIQFAQEVGQDALVFKLKGRAPEGVILSKAEIEKIGYEFGLLTRTA